LNIHIPSEIFIPEWLLTLLAFSGYASVGLLTWLLGRRNNWGIGNDALARKTDQKFFALLWPMTYLVILVIVFVVAPIQTLHFIFSREKP
jgi:heme/copper-type cytochrome/quinol oxidase subunit 2